MAKGKIDSRVYLRIDSQLLEAFRKHCASQGCSMSKRVREYIQTELRNSYTNVDLQKTSYLEDVE